MASFVSASVTETALTARPPSPIAQSATRLGSRPRAGLGCSAASEAAILAHSSPTRSPTHAHAREHRWLPRTPLACSQLLPPEPVAVRTRRTSQAHAGWSAWVRMTGGACDEDTPVAILDPPGVGGERPVSSASSRSVGSSICQGMPLTGSRCSTSPGRDRRAATGVARALRARPPPPCARPTGSGPRAPPHRTRASPRPRGRYPSHG